MPDFMAAVVAAVICVLIGLYLLWQGWRDDASEYHEYDPDPTEEMRCAVQVYDEDTEMFWSCGLDRYEHEMVYGTPSVAWVMEEQGLLPRNGQLLPPLSHEEWMRRHRDED